MTNRVQPEKQSTKELSSNVRHNEYYFAGCTAYSQRQTVEDCPYEMDGDAETSFRRISWMAGWYDCRTRARIGHILEKYNLQFP